MPAAHAERSTEPSPGATAAARAEPPDRAARVLFACALLVGLARFWKLSQWSLWFDEAATWTDLFVGLEGGEISNPLGYRLIGWTVAALGGVPDELALRFLPALAGWLAIPVVAWAFRPFAGARAAAAAALVLAASSWHVSWSQTARFYTLAQVVSLAGGAVVLRAYWRGRPLLAAVGFGIGALAALFHPSALLLLPALAVAPFALALARVPMPARVLRVAGFALLVGALALLARFDWVRDTFETYQRQKGTASPLEQLDQAVGRVAHFARTVGFYVTPLLGAAALAGAVRAALRREAFPLLAAGVCAIVLLLGALLAVFARMTAQYVFFLLPWVAVLACEPLSSAAAARERAGALRAAWLAVLVLPALATLGLYFTVRRGERPAWREAYQFVWSRREEGDLVLGMEATVGEYYVAPRQTDLRNTEHVAWLDEWRAREPERWSRHARRTWFLVNPEQFLDWDPRDAAEVQRVLREECRLVRSYPLYVESRDLSVWVYLRD